MTRQKEAMYIQHIKKRAKIDDRLKGTWTLQQYESVYRRACYNAVKTANPNWVIGQTFDKSILDSVTMESVEANLVKSGNTYVTKSRNYSV